MNYAKKILFPICFLLATIATYAQESQEYFFYDIGWKITVPIDFTLYDFIDQARNMQGSSEMSEEYDNSMDAFFSQTNIVAIKDRFNYFNITTSPFDSEEKSWENTVQLEKNEAYNNMLKIIGSEKLDTASSIEYIDGMAFNKFHIAVALNEDVQLHLFLISKLYKGYDFNITYLSLDNEARQQIELMLRSSRFNKNN